MKKILLPALLSFLLLFSVGTSAFAASIGDKLDHPEEGWTRYTNTSDIFKYGTGWEQSQETNGVTFSGTLTGKSKGELQFKFSGTKLRYLTASNYSYSKKVAISIDGNTQYFSPHNEAITDYKTNILIYESPTLTLGEHEVKVWTVEPSTNTLGNDYRFYGIDVIAEQTPTPEPEPIGNRAFLVITMNTGLEKEFDLSMSEVNDFINWYDTKENGTGPARYGINKQNNNKGPFIKRVDYVIFKNILSFEVNEYSIE
ncbi:bacterial surface protein [Paenibacillus turicensis]|uniref:bacterial surface protein n=1 Tax=Paenibacillus turicensis TaxID=160487 RepID=UPI003D298164